MSTVPIPKSAIVISSLVFGLLAAWYLIANAPETDNMGGTSSPKFKYETIKGFFAQDEDDTSENFDYENNNFGLLERTYDTDRSDSAKLTQWQRFEAYVDNLVESAPAGTEYKVIYQGRHGEGYHNLGEAKYGTKAWDEYWSKLDGDGELFWFDAHLSDKGKLQASHNNAFFKIQLAEAKMPAAQKYYSSPLYRCLQTANITFSGLELPADRPFKPTIKELLREVMGEHTCDKRSSKTVIHNAVPSWDIEPGFTEEDELFQVHHRETFQEHDARTQRFLDDIFEHDRNTFISFTSHSGAEASLLRVIEHREFRLPTGGLMPIFVKATRVN